MPFAGSVGRFHRERVNDIALGGGEPLAEVLFFKLVHHEADGAAVHAVNRNAGVAKFVQHLQHEAVAAERDHDFGFVVRHLAIGCRQARARGRRVGCAARDEGDLVVACGRVGHRLRAGGY
jgi:hypothetical protein